MKMVSCLLIAQLFILTSCSFYPFYSVDFTKKQMLAIKKGMTMDEVSYIIGKPNYRSFTENSEEWKYLGNDERYVSSIIKVHFSEGKVVGMTSYEKPFYTLPEQNANGYVTFGAAGSTNMACSRTDFDKFYESLRPWGGLSTCINMIERELPSMTITSAEALKLVNLFTFTDDKKKVAKITYPRVSDPGCFDVVIDSFTFLSDQNELKEFIKK